MCCSLCLGEPAVSYLSWRWNPRFACRLSSAVSLLPSKSEVFPLVEIARLPCAEAGGHVVPCWASKNRPQCLSPQRAQLQCFQRPRDFSRAGGKSVADAEQEALQVLAQRCLRGRRLAHVALRVVLKVGDP